MPWKTSSVTEEKLRFVFEYEQGGLLGIGIDEDTAAVVEGNRLEVLADGHVGI